MNIYALLENLRPSTLAAIVVDLESEIGPVVMAELAAAREALVANVGEDEAEAMIAAALAEWTVR